MDSGAYILQDKCSRSDRDLESSVALRIFLEMQSFASFARKSGAMSCFGGLVFFPSLLSSFHPPHSLGLGSLRLEYSSSCFLSLDEY